MSTVSSSRILTIQSHVIGGYVGNKAATFPLQLLGIDVDVINTVQVVNHSGYPHNAGYRLDAQQFSDIFSVLHTNHHDSHYDLILSGYLGSPDGVITIAKGIQSILNNSGPVHPSIYLLDPVLGDDGKLYLPKDMISLYNEHLIPLAHVLTPNQFEAESLTGIPITCIKSAYQAADQLYNISHNSPLIVITTLDTQDICTSSDTLALFLYLPSRISYIFTYPRLFGSFTGTGDLFTSLLAAILVKYPLSSSSSSSSYDDKFLHAIAGIIWVMQKVLTRTHIYATKLSSPTDTIADTYRKRELRIIQSRDDISQLFNVTSDDLLQANIIINKYDNY